MLWYKSWLETRWRFLIGLPLLMLSAAGLVLFYPETVKLLPLASSIDTRGEIGRRIKEALELQRTYRGFIWSQWFGQNLPQTWTLLAVMIGTGGLLSQASGQFFRVRYGLVGAMSAEAYFRSGELPWPGLLAGVALSALMLYGATRNIARQDF